MAGILFERRTPIGKFYRRRISRTIPALLIFFAIVIPIALWHGHHLSEHELVGLVTFTRTYMQPPIWSMSVPVSNTWSLNVEEHCYLLLSLFAFLAFRSRLVILARPSALLGFAFAIAAAQTPAQASDSLGFYVGAAIGQATLRANNAVLMGNAVDVTASSVPFSFSNHTSGWMLQLGLRPTSLIGAELEYIDFGNASASFSGGGVNDYLSYNARTSAKAAAAFGVLYLPLHLPRLDFYAKAGLARLETKTSAEGSFGCLADCPLYIGSFNRDQTKGRFAYGAGVQVMVGRFAIRGEYERISASTGDPDLLSLGATWNF